MAIQPQDNINVEEQVPEQEVKEVETVETVDTDVKDKNEMEAPPSEIILADLPEIKEGKEETEDLKEIGIEDKPKQTESVKHSKRQVLSTNEMFGYNWMGQIYDY